MSDLSGDFENDNLSKDVDVTGSSGSTDSSDSSDRTVALAKQAAGTPDYLSDVSDMGPTTHPDRSFMDKLNGARASVQPSRVVDLTEEEDAVVVRTTGHPSTSNREETLDEGSESSGSVIPPGDVELVMPGPNDLPSRPPLGHVTLSAEFFQANLRLPFHPFLRRAFRRLSVAPMQLNANAYRILISCFVHWAK
ncbi:hypothetical protein TIFTF001_035413 [Ficus carica]|uniref:Uncharacterized protein n=1 Tax=Ficus carica TaxID=3494 RepID=A0AA88E398_FICCA|nr:hypothetical protein TIFTF001_035413 [Ficus carica]